LPDILEFFQKRQVVMKSIKHLLDAVYEEKSLAEILDASTAALQGVSSSDADKLEAAFGVKTIRDLAALKYVRYAQAILALDGCPDFDPGPPPEWQQLFGNAPLDHYISHASGRFRIDYGPVYYHGRLDGTARLLIVGQDPATDEILAQRAFVDRSGQRLQGLLQKIGISRSYTMLNTFLYGIRGQFDSEMKKITREAPIIDFRNRLLDRVVATNSIEVVITIGAGARDAVERWPQHTQYPTFNLIHPSAPEQMVLPNWNQQLSGLIDAIAPDDPALLDPTPYGDVYTAEDELAIPRFDLPFGIADWHGTSGTRSKRDGDDKIIWQAVSR